MANGAEAVQPSPDITGTEAVHTSLDTDDTEAVVETLLIENEDKRHWWSTQRSPRFTLCLTAASDQVAGSRGSTGGGYMHARSLANGST